MRVKRKNMNRRRRLLKLGLLMISIIAVIILIDSRIRPVITTFAGYRVKNIAAKAINSAILDEFVDHEITYDKLVDIKRNEQNEVTSLTANTVVMNQIKSDLINMVLENIASSESEELQIPLGTLSGIQLLSGRGPSISIKILPSSIIDAYFVSELTSAGINQALHRISIHFSIDITAVIPGYTTSVQVETDVVVAETVIVGMTPDSYTEVTGDDGSLISKINDYGN